MPKYGHLSEIDPEFAPLQAQVDEMFTKLWSLPLDEFKAGWLNAPVNLPENAPKPDEDYVVEYKESTVRDGAKIGLKIYRPLKPASKALLVLKAHGGGEYQ